MSETHSEGTYVMDTAGDSISLTLYPKPANGGPDIPENAIYVAPDGDDTSGDGSEAKPYATLPKLNGLLVPGATVLMRGGSYMNTTNRGWWWASSGSVDALIKIWAYPGEKPVIDLSGCTAPKNTYFGSSHAGGNGVQCSNVSYTHWRGIEIRSAPMDGMCFYGDKGEGCVGNIIEQCSFTKSGRNGEIGNGFVAYRLGHGFHVLNCDSWANKNSAGNGNNADGFQFSTVGGDDNIASGLRGWLNGDDGYDLIALWDNTTQGKWTIVDCWAAKNGYKPDGTESGGDGNGFKLGGAPGTDRINARHVTHHCVAWSNKVDGFQDNDANASLEVYNCTSWNNNRTNLVPDYYGNFNFEGSRAKAILRNNLSALPAYGKIANVDNTDTEYNSWDGGEPPAEADFLSLDDTVALGPRNADGSLPSSDFLRLVAGSRYSDAGIDVDLPFAGEAPDLGAYEAGSAEV